jgi:hypothetical protein
VNAVVFLGPSLDRASARALLPEAVFLPPAGQADLLSAVGVYKPRVIGLIDGVFSQAQSVWHKEILFALDQQVAVVGASSMGALRAAELAMYGMQGVGEVYDLFRSGALEDDDEVAVAYAPAAHDFQVLSEPMVNVRATLNWAQSEGRLSEEVCAAVVRAAKRLHFTRRSLTTILDEAALPQPIAGAIREVFTAHYVDVKRADAQLLLQVIRDRQYAPPVTATSVRSRTFDRLYDEDRRVRHSGANVPLRTIATHAALNLAEFDQANFVALNRSLAQVLAGLLRVAPGGTEVAAEALRFRRERGLLEPADLCAWLEANDMTTSEWRSLMVELATCRELQRRLIAIGGTRLQTRSLLNELRLRGKYSEVARGAAAELIRTMNTELDSVAELTEQELQALVPQQLKTTGWELNAPLGQWAQEAGFQGLKDLAYELLQVRRARRGTLEVGKATDADVEI